MAASDLPPELARLVAEREAHRRRRDFTAADELRRRIAALGYEVSDTSAGPVVASIAPLRGQGPTTPLRELPASYDASVQWVVEGWPQDVLRGIAAVGRHHRGWRIQYVVADVAATSGESWPDDVEVLRLDTGTGWAEARNAALERSLGRVVIVMDGSLEPTGDILGPLTSALDDQRVGLCGPFGLVTSDLRDFHSSPGPAVDAVEGYLMAFRRETIAATDLFDPGFRFYRTADVELSFRIRSMGLRAVVVPLPVERHEHRMWEATPEAERERLSRRNHFRFLDRWRERTDLVTGVPPGDPAPDAR